ncbi:hypothetical protein AMJ49_05755 [Parcubacteria bacterium DG_74_2]|nr:MAG: hypothetical protein AMJ49_05755 [Parcubacteria bacterium DG_74_2]
MLKEFLDQFYLDKHKERDQEHFYVTDAGRCSRAVFFKFKNAPKREMDANILRLFEHGDYVQMHILNNLFSLGIVRASEIYIPPQEMINGRADAIITLNNELYVVDVKSMNSMIFRKLEYPKQDNINQIQLYLHFFKIPKGILLYVNKDTLELKEFLVDYDSSLAKSLLDSLELLKTKIDADIIPERTPGYPKNWQCRYCAFKEICSLTGESEMKWEDFKTKIQSQNG